MSRIPPIVAAVLTILSLLAAPATGSATGALSPADGDERRMQREFIVDDERELRIEFPVGELRVEKGDDDRIEGEMEVDCDGWFADCDDLDRVDLVASRRGDQIRLEVEGVDDGIDGVEIDLALRVPSRLALEIDMGVGEVRVREMERDVRVHLGVGDVRVEAPEEIVESVDLRVGVGETGLRTAAGRGVDGSGFLSRSLRWDEGAGEARISVEIGVGDADVVLR